MSAPTQQPAPEADDFVAHVLRAVTGGLDVDLDPQALSGRMESAAEEFDRRTATAFCEALLDQLGDDPGNVRLLEALVILGLAHPAVLSRARISLAVEGRRLAILLERGGEPERARALLEFLAAKLPGERTIDQELAALLRRTGGTEDLVERYLDRAHASVERGRIGEAIPWLQEVLLLDRTRRDVARMIRDLRYGEAARARSSRRRTRWAVGLATVTALATVGVAWNQDATTRFDRLPSAASGDRCAWTRFGATAPFGDRCVLRAVAWRADEGGDDALPAGIRAALAKEARGWRDAPRDLEEIRAMQAGEVGVWA